jgi:flagellar biosynthesis protein FlhG
MRIISITSGKGGVGKSTIVANISSAIARTNQSVMILDGDLGTANQDIMFGVRPNRNLSHSASGATTMSEIVQSIEPNLKLIPGAIGVRDVYKMNDARRRNLLDQVKALCTGVDILLIDTAPGIDDSVLFLNAASQSSFVVVTPEPASLTDSYALIKLLNRYYGRKRFSIICNEVRDEAEGMALFSKISEIADKHLCVGLDYAGSIPFDPMVRRATKLQQLAIKTFPQSPGSQAFVQLAKNVSHSKTLDSVSSGVGFLWENVVGVA